MERGALELAEALATNKFLLYLNLTGNAIANEGLSYILPAVAQCNTLERLNLSSNEITSGTIRQTAYREKIKTGFGSKIIDFTAFPSLKPLK